MSTFIRLLLLFSFITVNIQSQDKEILREIYDLSLTKSKAYENLRELCKEIGPRLSGSEEADSAVAWEKEC